VNWFFCQKLLVQEVSSNYELELLLNRPLALRPKEHTHVQMKMCSIQIITGGVLHCAHGFDWSLVVNINHESTCEEQTAKQFSNKQGGSRGCRDWKKRPGVDFFFLSTLGGLTNYIIRHTSIYGNIMSSVASLPCSWADSLHILHPSSASTSACGETLFRFNHPKSLDFSGSTSAAMATWSATDSATFPGEHVSHAVTHFLCVKCGKLSMKVVWRA